MKGDFSRIRFNPAKNYTSVLQQQGRVALDADANEQCFIDEYMRDVTNYDVIGPVGGPAGAAGFALKLEGSQILIEPGRYYVDGLLVENLQTIPYDKQPYLLGAPTSKEILLKLLQGKGQLTARFILEVWQRLVTDLDDTCLREPALGQADTTTRLQTVWRVVGFVPDPALKQEQPADSLRAGGAVLEQDPVTGGEGSHPVPILTETIPPPSPCSDSVGNAICKLSFCCQSMYEPIAIPRTGTMFANTSDSGDCGCQPIAPAGYQGLENQLYRVEIHHSGTLDTATFKWSRENGSVVTQITAIAGAIVTASSLGPDANLGFQAGQWVELSDDTYLFGIIPNKPGVLFQIQALGPNPLEVTLASSATGVVDPGKNARMRRWDQPVTSGTTAGIPLSATAQPLENGIQVTFATGDYITGDYWTIPARTATGQIDWPPCGALDSQPFQPADFTEIFTAPLACIHSRLDVGVDQGTDLGLDSTGVDSTGVDNRLFLVDDCRLFFPPLTALCGNSTATAIHVQSVSWNNDDYMTIDALVANGLTVTLDQAPSSPVTGASFSVIFETTAPAVGGNEAAWFSPGNWPTTVLRGVTIVDSYVNLTVNGSTLFWTLPLTQGDPTQTLVVAYLDLLLSLGVAAGWFARVRVKLLGRAIFANSAAGQLYLDGQAFGQPATRVDGTSAVGLQFPSGNGETASDFESWFYLAPTVLIGNVIIQGLTDAGLERTVNAVKVLVDGNNNMIGLQTGETLSIPITNLRALITLNYAPVTDTTVTLTLSGPGVGSIISIEPTVNVTAGTATALAPINILSNPGGGPGDTYTLIAGVSTALGNISFNPPPTLNVSGSTPQQQIG